MQASNLCLLNSENGKDNKKKTVPKAHFGQEQFLFLGKTLNIPEKKPTFIIIAFSFKLGYLKIEQRNLRDF